MAFSWGLALVEANLDQRAAERSYDIAERELIPAVDWSAYSLRKAWNAVKWWRENSKETYASGLANLSAALGLARHIERGTARIRSATVRFTRGRWFVAFSVEVRRADRASVLPGAVVGVDLGITNLAVLSQPVAGVSDEHAMVADRFYPSSKMCSSCRAVKTELRLSNRVFYCDSCGHRADRDRNAAANLAALTNNAPSMSSPSCGATKNEPAGKPCKTNIVGSGYRHGNTPEVNVA
ncbi:putative transposase [Nocardia nova SH22a]|uniref:Putative transposase n=1 Tax=Nocardia nova SH22a TaxID=1415166 RepID=W5TDS4_9NOCA|nr:zinc ribbon domain-containing protein [Nocardia nova]AHH15381.1 putative transposase [Nocardia nova SH22a]